MDYPQGASEAVYDGLALMILDFVECLQDGFYRNIDPIIQAEPKAALHLGVGLTVGRAWLGWSGLGNERLSYMGDPIREAFQLQKRALPCGLVANFRLGKLLFMERLCAQEGVIREEKEGLDRRLPIWDASGHPRIRRRRAKKQVTKDLSAALAWLENPYDDADSSDLDELSLSSDDTERVFDVREFWEPRFAAGLARLVEADDGWYARPARIDETIRDMRDMVGNERVAETPQVESVWRRVPFANC
jgi:hypothetical protein